MAEHMLTTLDNPYDPFTQFDDWYEFDVRSGYNTSAYLDRVTITSDELSEADQDLAQERAMLEIMRENITGNYRMVERKPVESESSQD